MRLFEGRLNNKPRNTFKAFLTKVKSSQVAVNEHLSNKIEIIYNETSDEILFLKNGELFTESYLIYDLNGKIILQEESNKLSLSNLNSGLYILKFSSGIGIKLSVTN